MIGLPACPTANIVAISPSAAESLRLQVGDGSGHQRWHRRWNGCENSS